MVCYWESVAYFEFYLKKEGGRWKIEVEDKCLENAIFHLFNLLITIC